MTIKLFKLTCDLPLSDSAREALHTHWISAVAGTDIEGSRLLILPNGLDVTPMSSNAVLQEAARVLEQRGKHVYAAEMRKLAGGQ